MKKQFAHFLLCCLILVNARALLAESQTFDIIRFDVPQGWKKDSKQGVVIYSNISGNSFCVLSIYASIPSFGSPEKDFQNEWQALAVTPFQAAANPETEIRARPDGWKLIAGGSKIEQNGFNSLILLSVFSGFGKAASVLVNLNDQAYLTQIDSLLEKIELNTQRSAPPSGGISSGLFKGEGIVGAYEGLKLGSVGLSAAYAVFLSNGQVYFNDKFPLRGLDGLNTQQEASERARFWGTYSLQGGKGVMKMIYQDIPIEVNGNDLWITTQNKAHKYARLPSVDGAVLNGNYGFEGDWNGSPPSITFNRDGTFLDRGVLNVVNHQTTDPGGSVAPGSGRYEAKNFTLTFYFSDGRVLHVAFPGIGFNKNEESPATLTMSFNNDVIVRQ